MMFIMLIWFCDCREGFRCEDVCLFVLGGRMDACAKLNMRSCLMLCSANVVDIFNAITETWSTAALSEAKSYAAATSLPNAGIAFFAGGQTRGMLFVF